MEATLTVAPRLPIRCSSRPPPNSVTFNRSTVKFPKLTFPKPSRCSVTKPVKNTVVAALPNLTNLVSKLIETLSLVETICNKYGGVLKMITQLAKASRELLTLLKLLMKFLKKVGEIDTRKAHKNIAELYGERMKKKGKEVTEKEALGDEVVEE